jgi:hypothetical protein
MLSRFNPWFNQTNTKTKKIKVGFCNITTDFESFLENQCTKIEQTYIYDDKYEFRYYKNANNKTGYYEPDTIDDSDLDYVVLPFFRDFCSTTCESVGYFLSEHGLVKNTKLILVGFHDHSTGVNMKYFEGFKGVEFVSIDNFSDTRKGDIMQIILPRLK